MEFIIFGIFIVTVILLVAMVVRSERKKPPDGELIIDTSDPEKDIYRLELGNEFENLAKKKTITLKVTKISRSQL